jgi:bifunctional non-homologous end joining protein LigD
MNTTFKVGRATIVISHSEKIWFPADGITKMDIVAYYNEIAPVMIPYMKNRPVNMNRFPEGIRGESFYHKDVPDYFPSWIKRVPIKKGGGLLHQVVCNTPATLVYLATQACLTPHIWLSRYDKINYPDRMIFDLDPGSDFNVVRDIALKLKELLEAVDLIPFVMTTGSRGLHVVVPLKRTYEFAQVRGVARMLGQHLVQENPLQLTMEMSKEKRGKKLFIDVLRNSYSATGVAPYSVRAQPKAPVATPLAWDEVKDKKLTAQRYTIKTIFKKLHNDGDAWQGIDSHARSLKKALTLLNA